MTHEQIQNLLAFLGYYKSRVDGIWGPASRKALTEFQRSAGLSATGEADNTTQTALLKAVASWEPEREKVVDAENATTTGTFWDEIEFFHRSEFKCTCGGRGCSGFPVEPVERLVRNADAARRYFGRSAPVSSGVRCQLRNSELPGSAANSLHMRGKAMDFAIHGVSSAQLLTFVKTLPEVHEAYAIDDSYVHMGVQKY